MGKDKKLGYNYLLFDTSTETLSIAIIRNGELVFDFHKKGISQHLQMLIPEIDGILNRLGMEISDIDGIITGTGPGSFTGIRIGVTSANILARFGNKEICGISTLDIIVSGLIGNCGERLVFPVIDGRKSKIYTAGYLIEKDLIKRETEIMDIKPEDFCDYINKKAGKLIILGPGLNSYFNFFKENMGIHCNIADAEYWYPRVSNIFKILEMIKMERNVLVQPLYIRKSDAELNYHGIN